MGIFDLPNLPAMQIPQYQNRTSTGIGGLADVINQISEAQRQRKLDQMKLKEAEMALAEKQRAQAQDAAMRAEIMKISGATMPDGSMTPDTGFSLNPMSPVPLMPDAKRTTRPLNDEEIDDRLSQAALKSGNYDMFQKVQTNLKAKREERALKTQGYDVQKERMRNAGMLAFSKNPEAMRMMASANPEGLRALGFDPDAVNALPADVDKSTTPETITLPNGRTRIFVMSKSGVPHFLDKYTANMADSEDEMARQLIFGRIQASGEQARITQQTGAALTPRPYVDPATGQNRLGTMSPQGIAPVPVVTGGYSGALPEPDPNAPIPAPFVDPLAGKVTPSLQPDASSAPMPLPSRLDAGKTMTTLYAGAPKKSNSGMDADVRAGAKWLSSQDYKSYAKLQDSTAGFYAAYDQSKQRTASNQSDATAQIAGLYKFISGLDQSVVRPTELELFGRANTLMENFALGINRIGSPEEIRATTSRVMDDMKDILDRIQASAEIKAEGRRQYYSEALKGNIPPLPGAQVAPPPASGTMEIRTEGVTQDTKPGPDEELVYSKSRNQWALRKKAGVR